MRRPLLLLLFIFMTAPAHAQLPRRAAASGDELLSASARLLFVTAHPDDESLVAPLMGQACGELQARCELLVLTRGEHGDCALPEGCGPNLGELRLNEARNAAALLHADGRFLQYPDRFADVREAWGTRPASDIADEIRSFAPTAVITFDSRHGSSCHPAHRLTAELTIAALAQFANAPPLFYIETFHRELRLDDATPGAPGLRTYSGGWDYLLADVALHASQFTFEQRRLLADTPPERQHVWLLDARLAPLATYVYGCE